MQAIARKVKSLRGVGGVERGQNIFDLIDEVSSDPAAVATLKKSLQSPMLEARDHMPQCTVTSVTCQPDTCGQSRDLEQIRTNALPALPGLFTSWHNLARRPRFRYNRARCDCSGSHMRRRGGTLELRPAPAGNPRWFRARFLGRKHQ